MYSKTIFKEEQTMTIKEAVAAAIGGIGAAFIAGKVVFGGKKNDTTATPGETTSATTAETTTPVVETNVETPEEKSE